MERFTFDGLEIATEAEAAMALAKLKEEGQALAAKADAAEAGKAELEKNVSELQAKLDSAEAMVADLKKQLDEMPAKLQALADAKAKLHSQAAEAGVEVQDGMSDEDVVKAIIKSVSPEANLDGKDASYLAARLDGAMELVAQRKAAEVKADVADNPTPDQNKHQDSADEARSRMINRMTNAWKGETKE